MTDRHELIRRALLALAPLLVVVGIPGAIELWNRPDPGFAPREYTVGVVDPAGPAQAAGLEAGDLLLRMNGSPITHPAAYWAYLHPLRAGDQLELTILRGSTQGTVTYTLPPSPPRLRLRDLLMTAVGTAFLFLGFVTYLKRNDALGRYFHLTCVLLSYSFLPLPTFPWVGFMQILESVRSVLQLLLPAVFLRFFLIFPEGAPADAARWRRHRAWFLPPLVLASFHVAFNFLPRIDLTALTVLQILSAAMLVIYVVIGFAVFLRKMRRRERWNLWIKLRLAVFSLAAGLLPLMVATLARQIWPSHNLPDQAALLLLPLAPAGFSLALLRAGAIDLATLGRQALIALALAIPVLGLAVLLLGGLVPSNQGDLRYLIAVLFTFVAAVAAVPMRRRVGSLVDRTFYPERDRIRTESARLGDALSQQRKPTEVAEALCRGLGDMLDARGAFLYGVTEHGFEILAATETGTEPPAQLDRGSRLLQAVMRSGEMCLVEPLLTGAGAVRFDADSRRLIDATESVLLSPLIAGGETVAVLALGPSRLRRDYGALELYHVELLARQAAASLENAKLHEEDLQRERVQVEMGLAREIQANLLPEAPLILPGVEIHGSMEASLEIGGDLFDFFQVDADHVAVTVADAAGKGVPASLLMSGVRSAVREVMQPGIDCAEALSKLNHDVVGMTGDRHFVALFLGILDWRRSVLEYGVAGIEPPLWVRASLRRAERLTRGGPVLGVSPNAAFQTGLVRLHPNDSLLVFSDGLTDEEAPSGEPFGYERLIRHALSRAELPAGDMLSRLMADIRSYGEGTSTDDQTLLVLRVKDLATEGMEDAALSG